MKRHFISLTICAVTAISSLFIVFNPAAVSAETKAENSLSQAQLNPLVTMAIPPYKW